MSNDYFKAQGWFKNYATSSEDSRGVFQELVKEDEEAFRLASAKTDRIKAMMNEQYGPGTIKYGSEIKQPEIKTPQAAFEFSQRNPAAEGGRMRFDEGLSAKKKKVLKKVLTITYPKDATKDLEIKKSGFDDMNLKRRLDAYEKLEETYGKEFVEEEFKKKHGVSFRDIASKKEHNGKKVTNIIDGFKKKITGFYKSENTSPTYNEKTGHIYKKANKFGTVYSTEPATKPKAQNQKLIDDITADAPNMSQKELIEKYKINKNTLTTIRDENNLKFRQSYLPEGEQKKLIPYEDRFSAQEKSDMYIKRKATETDADRANARERKKKYMDKTFKDYKMEPSSRTPYDDLWKDIARSSKDGERIKLVEGPKYSSGATYADFKTRVFLDTKTGETFNYNNLKKYLDSGKLEGVTYDSAIEPYNLKNQIAKSGLRENIQKAYFGDKYQPPKVNRSQNTFHVHHINGVASDPFSVQLTFADENMGLVHNKTFNKNWAKLIEKNAPLSKRKEYLKFVKSKIQDNIAQTLDFPEVGKTKTFGEIGTDMQKLLSNEKFKDLDLKSIDYIGSKKDFVGVNSGFNTDLLMKDPLVQKLLNSKSGKAIAQSLRGTAGAVGKVFGGADIILGIVDYENNISKGQKPNEALQNAFQAMSINLYKGGDRARTEEVKKFFVKNGGDGKIFDQVTLLNTKDQEINDLIYKSKFTADKAFMDLSKTKLGLGESIDQRKKDYSILKKQLNEKIKNTIEERDGMVESYKTNLRVSEAGAPIQIGNQDFFSKPFKDTRRATMDKIESENKNAYDMQKRQVNYLSGNIGNYLQNNIFTLDPVEKAKQQKLINEMDERELYKFNLQRGMDPDNPIRIEDILRYKQTSPDLMGVNTTKYVNYDDRKAEGGIIGLRSKYEYKK